MKKLIYVLSNSYSGSTLFDLFIGNQPQFRSLGEIHRIASTQSERLQVFGNRCSCNQRLHECDYWESARQHVMKSMGFRNDSDWSELPFESPKQFYRTRSDVVTTMIGKADSAIRYILSRQPSKLALEQGVRQWYFFDSISDHFGVDFLVDSSKSIAPLLRLAHTRPKSIVIVRLIRDGRGVMNSMLKRSHGSTNPNSVVKKWYRQSLMFDRIVQRLGVDNLVINYESFCENPRETLDTLNKKIYGNEVPISSNIITEISGHHIIPGNTMSQNKRISLKLDETWRQELSVKSLDAFKRHGEALNIRYGYY